jgi:hypothetical protein
MVDPAWAAPSPSPAAASRQQKGLTPPASPGRPQAAAGAPAPQRKASARQLLERVQPGLAAAADHGMKQQQGAGGGKEQGGAGPAAGRHPFEMDTADRFLAQAMAQVQVGQGQAQGQAQAGQAAQRQALLYTQQQVLQATGGGRLAPEQMPAAGAR